MLKRDIEEYIIIVIISHQLHSSVIYKLIFRDSIKLLCSVLSAVALGSCYLTQRFTIVKAS